MRGGEKSLSIESNRRDASSSSPAAKSQFEKFDLDRALLRGIAAAGFTEPRSIQRDAMPAALEGRDVLGLAQTGTGKTAAFALPLLQLMLEYPGKGPRALVLAPTRELANQIAEEIKTLAKFTRVEVTTIFGGISQNRQVTALRRRPEIVVGCPGRVLDLLQQGLLHLDAVEALVLDEADHMFDMGFLPSIRKIMNALPSDRQNLLFSATMPKEIRGLANEILKDALIVELADRSPASTIEHALYMIPETSKRDLLKQVLNRKECRTAIVFTRTKYRARKLAEQLQNWKYPAIALQGNMSQSQRDRAMKGFRDGTFKILVATDIAARGIDVSKISHVINFDVPDTPDAYTHRIGRTGRAEQEGIAYTFVTGADGDWVRQTERKIGKKIRRDQVEGFEADTETSKAPKQSRARKKSGGRPPRARAARGPGSGPGRGRGRGPSGGGASAGGPGAGQSRGPAKGRGGGAGRSQRRRTA